MAELVQLRSFFRGTRESIKLSNQCILILADQGFGYFGVLGKFAMEAWLADEKPRPLLQNSLGRVAYPHGGLQRT